MNGTPTTGSLALDDEIRIGVSSCLLGQEVRYDGGRSVGKNS
jgi:uncharacterized protein YbbK (DUF523 family)